VATVLAENDAMLQRASTLGFVQPEELPEAGARRIALALR
jgi:hypothetical protein